MFLGEFLHTIDDKGRLTLPAKFRSDLDQGIVVTRGVDKCLFIFPTTEFRLLADRISNLRVTQAQARDLARHFFSGACDVDLDKQGRVLIPQNLREFAGINGEVVVVGVDKRIEIWGVPSWEQARAQFEESATSGKDPWAMLDI